MACIDCPMHLKPDQFNWSILYENKKCLTDDSIKKLAAANAKINGAVFSDEEYEASKSALRNAIHQESSSYRGNRVAAKLLHIFSSVPNANAILCLGEAPGSFADHIRKHMPNIIVGVTNFPSGLQTLTGKQKEKWRKITSDPGIIMCTDANCSGDMTNPYCLDSVLSNFMEKASSRVSGQFIPVLTCDAGAGVWDPSFDVKFIGQKIMMNIFQNLQSVYLNGIMVKWQNITDDRISLENWASFVADHAKRINNKWRIFKPAGSYQTNDEMYCIIWRPPTFNDVSGYAPKISPLDPVTELCIATTRKVYNWAMIRDLAHS